MRMDCIPGGLCGEKVGGGEMMKSIGHFVGQRVAYLIGLPGGDGLGSDDLRLSLEVLATHTNRSVPIRPGHAAGE